VSPFFHHGPTIPFRFRGDLASLLFFPLFPRCLLSNKLSAWGPPAVRVSFCRSFAYGGPKDRLSWRGPESAAPSFPLTVHRYHLQFTVRSPWLRRGSPYHQGFFSGQRTLFTLFPSLPFCPPPGQPWIVRDVGVLPLLRVGPPAFLRSVGAILFSGAYSGNFLCFAGFPCDPSGPSSYLPPNWPTCFFTDLQLLFLPDLLARQVPCGFPDHVLSGPLDPRTPRIGY